MRSCASLLVVRTALAVALMSGACGGTTDVRLSIVQVQGTVTSTADSEPIEDVGVVLTYPLGSGRGTGETSWTDSLGRYAVSLTDIV
ncbi:MAG: hypothetical protein OEW06_11110, partial [Gemmatimonadota bacterium]|nr:hypothetical protein [Gemmatimonadota bacterium]